MGHDILLSLSLSFSLFLSVWLALTILLSLSLKLKTMSSLASPWIPRASILTTPSKFPKFQSYPPPPPSSSSSSCFRVVCRAGSNSQQVGSDLKFVLHEALESSGIDTSHARVTSISSSSSIYYFFGDLLLFASLFFFFLNFLSIGHVLHEFWWWKWFYFRVSYNWSTYDLSSNCQQIV